MLIHKQGFVFLGEFQVGFLYVPLNIKLAGKHETLHRSLQPCLPLVGEKLMVSNWLYIYFRQLDYTIAVGPFQLNCSILYEGNT